MAGKPLEDDMFGVTYQAGKAYDFSSMQINGFFWQYGGDIWRKISNQMHKQLVL